VDPVNLVLAILVAILLLALVVVALGTDRAIRW
jgi:hypothetical protein